MLRSILLVAVLLGSSFSTSAAFGASCEEQLRAVSSKFNFSLEKTFEDAIATQTDLRTVFIVGILKVAQRVESKEEIFNIFQDSNTQIRAVIPGRDGTIVTFVSSLAGVLNAACVDEVVSIQMSQKLDGTAGMTVRN